LTMLSYDHGFLRQVLDVLEVAVKKRAAVRFKPQMIEIVGFLEKFMDKFHHGKEEKFLFPVAMKSSPSLIPDIKKLISDHEHARELLQTMGSELGEERDMDRYGELSLSLVNHMTAHIREEEDIFFPKIEKDLGAEEDGKIYRAFNNFTVGLFYKFFEQTADKIQDDILGSGFYESIT
jgi:hemerythrin-like domain-containing protein